MKKILIVAYLFLPTATTGVHRAAKFVKYLGQFGWQATVITAEHSITLAQDNSLCADFPADLRAIKVSSFERSLVQRYIDRLLGFLKLRDHIGDAVNWRLAELYKKREMPDQHAPWAIKASERAEKLLENEHFDALLTTSWPYSDHLVGLSVVKKFDLPWIADFRDPWIANTNYQRSAGSAIGRAERLLEREIALAANAVLATSAHTVDDFRQRYPGVGRNQFQLLRNGYDSDDFPQVDSAATSGPLMIAFVGSFYRDRSPLVMIKALKRLSSKGITPANVQVKFVGGMGG